MTAQPIAYQGEIGRETTASIRRREALDAAYQGEIGRETTAVSTVHMLTD